MSQEAILTIIAIAYPAGAMLMLGMYGYAMELAKDKSADLVVMLFVAVAWPVILPFALGATIASYRKGRDS